jgi:hypothetical protein
MRLISAVSGVQVPAPPPHFFQSPLKEREMKKLVTLASVGVFLLSLQGITLAQQKTPAPAPPPAGVTPAPPPGETPTMPLKKEAKGTKKAKHSKHKKAKHAKHKKVKPKKAKHAKHKKARHKKIKKSKAEG